MSWRNTDRAFGSRPRGLRGVDGMGRSHAYSSSVPHPDRGVHGLDGLEGLEGFVPPFSIPTLRWRNTDRSYGNRPKGLPFSGVGLGDAATDAAIGTDIGTMVGTDIASNPTLMNLPPTYNDVASGSANWPQAVTNIAQQGFQDAFSVLKLLNPVPPGTTMVTGPYGTSISRAASGTAAAPSLSLSSGSGLGIILLVGLGALVLFASKGH